MKKFYKTFQFDLTSVEDVSEELRIVKGYASTWNRDLGGDRFDPKAFDETIQEHFTLPYSRKGSGDIRFCREHSIKDIIGRIDVLRTDDKGLYFEAYISKTFWGEDTYILLKDRAIDKVSVGFSIEEELETEEEKVILKARLWEISIVGIPMNWGAETVEVKSMDRENFNSLTEIIESLASKFDETLIKFENKFSEESVKNMVITLNIRSKNLETNVVDAEVNGNEAVVDVVVEDEKCCATNECQSAAKCDTGGCFTQEQLAYLKELFAPIVKSDEISEVTTKDNNEQNIDSTSVVGVVTVEIKSTEDNKEDVSSDMENLQEQLDNEIKSYLKYLTKEKK